LGALTSSSIDKMGATAGSPTEALAEAGSSVFSGDGLVIFVFGFAGDFVDARNAIRINA
jgi:hypothetical protein